MRRVVPPPRLRIRQATHPPVCRIAAGPDGLGLGDLSLPSGTPTAEWGPIALSVGSPYKTAGLSAAANGAIMLSWLPGVVQSIVVPDLAQAFDRRPPGAAEAYGAAGANAALLRADDGWRAVVLPSLGDRLPDLGAGPVAISADAQQVAVAEANAIVVMPLAGGPPVAEYPGSADALAFAGGRLWVARGGAVAPAGTDAGSDGSPVVALAGAASAERILVLDADGQITRYGDGEPAITWEPLIAGVSAISLSDDGDWATLAGPDAVAVVRADTGAVGVYVAGASAIAFARGDRLVVGGGWGMALIVSVKESV